jgi:hypothetical protein
VNGLAMMIAIKILMASSPVPVRWRLPKFLNGGNFFRNAELLQRPLVSRCTKPGHACTDFEQRCKRSPFPSSPQPTGTATLVSANLETAKAELRRRVPTPSDDIEERIRAYVESTARPTITGIGKGEKLKVVWPGAGWDVKGPIEHRAEVLPMMAPSVPCIQSVLCGAAGRLPSQDSTEPSIEQLNPDVHKWIVSGETAVYDNIRDRHSGDRQWHAAR